MNNINKTMIWSNFNITERTQGPLIFGPIIDPRKTPTEIIPLLRFPKLINEYYYIEETPSMISIKKDQSILTTLDKNSFEFLECTPLAHSQHSWYGLWKLSRD